MHNAALMLVVPPAFSAKSIQDFIALAKAAPRQLNMASAGLGSGTHFAGEIFNRVQASKSFMCAEDARKVREIAQLIGLKPE